MPRDKKRKVKGKKGKKGKSFAVGQDLTEGTGAENTRGALTSQTDPGITAFIDDMNKTDDWEVCTRILSTFLGFPDVSTRSGLKDLHKEFDRYNHHLDKVLDRHYDNDNIVSGVMGIYAKMCVDSILRDKLLKNNIARFLDKLLSILDRPKCRLAVFQIITNMTDYGDIKILAEVVKKSSTLARILVEQTSDAKHSERVIAIITRSVLTFIIKETPDRGVLECIDMPHLVQTIIRRLQRWNKSTEIMSQAILFLSHATPLYSDVFFKYPTAINLLVACTRSNDIQFRSMGVLGILQLHYAKCEMDDTLPHPKKILEAFKMQAPNNLTGAVMSNGNTGAMLRSLKASYDFYRAINRVVRDHDLYMLGKTVAELTLVTDFHIPKGNIRIEDPKTHKYADADNVLPFAKWMDALPHCADAIRRKGVYGEEDLADIIELKYLTKSCQVNEANNLAKRAMERSPSVGFYYYVLALCNTGAIGLRWAKKGLRCSQLTDYAFINALLEGRTSGAVFDEGVAFISSALEDSKAYIDNAPADSIHMKKVIYIYILVYFVAKGHEMSADLTALKGTLDHLKIVEDLSIFFGGAVPNTQWKLAYQTLIGRTPLAAKEWDEIVKKYSTVSKSANDVSREKAGHDLSAWLESAHSEDGSSMHASYDGSKFYQIAHYTGVTLYTCSWCAHPSVALKRCRGCGKVRYCDTHCQKEHWREGHKEECKRNATKTLSS